MTTRVRGPKLQDTTLKTMAIVTSTMIMREHTLKIHNSRGLHSRGNRSSWPRPPSQSLRIWRWASYFIGIHRCPNGPPARFRALHNATSSELKHGT